MPRRTVLLSYCLEKSYEPAVVSEALAYIVRIHERMKLRATLFVTGRVLATNGADFAALAANPFLDFASHTYDHIGLKPNLEDRGTGITYIPPASPREIADDLGRYNAAYRAIFRKDCRGLCSPRGFYRGFSDRPDVLALISAAGYEYVVSWTRNERDWFPCARELSPFTYSAQGYPGILEIPTHGWQDAAWAKVRPETLTSGYWATMREDACATGTAGDRVFGFSLHDWVIHEHFLETGHIEAFYADLMKADVGMMSYGDYSRQRRS